MAFKIKENPGLPGWEFNIGGLESIKERTGQDGIISREVKAGTYRIYETPKSGWFSTTEVNQTVTLNSGEEKKIFFGNKGPQLITKFGDRNANGKMDSGETRVCRLEI
jgi:hypothetical protein